ncbi:MAG: ATP-binding protein [Polymorphobacter sp.]|uniref:sensor histidine kinase NtrY-like n=1 Tax=Polymorphobacter sp. TaxID=1909290 RepID=UPI003A896B05
MNKAMDMAPALRAQERRAVNRKALGWRLRLWGRRLVRALGGRQEIYPRLELAAAAATLIIGWASYALVTGRSVPATGASPTLVTALVVANILPVMLLMVLMARRIALLLANRRQGVAGAQLHVRLVGLFAGIAAVPTVLVVIFASLLFQYGVQFWFSDRVKTILEGSNQVAQAYIEENRQRVADDIVPMSSDVANYARDFGEGTELFGQALQFQVAARNLSEAAVFARNGDKLVPLALNGLEVTALAARLERMPAPGRPEEGAAQAVTLVARGGDRIEAVVAVPGLADRFIYVSRKVDPAVLARADRAAGALFEYRELIERSRVMQLRFNLVLIAVSLLTLAVAMWFALWLANRMVTPIARLALAAERVGAGDLDARVPAGGARDEISTLARAFNRMTGQLKTQQSALLEANRQLDRRRRFTEAVLSGVSAGVLSIDGGGVVRSANRSAAALLESDEAALAGQRLEETVPELAAWLQAARETGRFSGQVKIVRGAETQTLSVRIAADAGGSGGPDGEGGQVLTFDDISAQLADQRRAAWADVARRIAHEIKNPLTPIQLAAERLQRKFGRQVVEDRETFSALTSMIVRQVGDLHRMVNEFSDFARLPAPVFAPEDVGLLVREALVLQDVAFPALRFSVTGGEGAAPLMCDRQQMMRLMTNVLKNAGEAVTARIERDGEPEGGGAVEVRLADDGAALSIEVVDNGVGLPAERRDQLTEPYVTTRARGTGLGLAIVKKIVEDHGGTLTLADGPDGGALVRMVFVRAASLRQAAE